MAFSVCEIAPTRLRPIQTSSGIRLEETLGSFRKPSLPVFASSCGNAFLRASLPPCAAYEGKALEHNDPKFRQTDAGKATTLSIASNNLFERIDARSSIRFASASPAKAHQPVLSSAKWSILETLETCPGGVLAAGYTKQSPGTLHNISAGISMISPAGISRVATVPSFIATRYPQLSAPQCHPPRGGSWPLLHGDLWDHALLALFRSGSLQAAARCDQYAGNNAHQNARRRFQPVTPRKRAYVASNKRALPSMLQGVQVLLPVYTRLQFASRRITSFKFLAYSPYGTCLGLATLSASSSGYNTRQVGDLERGQEPTYTRKSQDLGIWATIPRPASPRTAQHQATPPWPNHRAPRPHSRPRPSTQIPIRMHSCFPPDVTPSGGPNLPLPSQQFAQTARWQLLSALTPMQRDAAGVRVTSRARAARRPHTRTRSAAAAVLVLRAN
ncbi:hypothetical protein CERSUDRAFT_120501 [Gelatoporia subvermispora B]|uniref:Uncharacterized protein n=1 Tax=Ceriporiopsis subvermispora (strain B) TaxID=914234 RepID=M2RAF1_CERS8|nr:hypothetical protein CERSUDRAFT_120501 [Gelatoporia subvermispora B]